MILAAGLGTRLKPLTDSMPKPLIPVAGRPMIEYPIRLLQAHGVTEVVVNLHHLGEQIRAALGDGSRFGMRFEYSFEPEILGTAGGIRKARDLLGVDPFYVVNCDVIADVDLDAVRQFHERCDAVATLVLRPDPNSSRFGEIGIDHEGRVREFLGKMGWSGQPLTQLMFTGVSLLDPRVHRWIPPGERVDISDTVYPAMLRAGERVWGLVHRGYWMDLGEPARLRQAEEDLCRKRISVPGLAVGEDEA